MLNVIESADQSLRAALKRVHHLFVLDIIERELADYLLLGLVTPELGREVERAVGEACKEIAPDSLALVEAFGLTNELLTAPIATDWIGFNEKDTRGEVTA